MLGRNLALMAFIDLFLPCLCQFPELGKGFFPISRNFGTVSAVADDIYIGCKSFAYFIPFSGKGLYNFFGDKVSFCPDDEDRDRWIF